MTDLPPTDLPPNHHADYPQFTGAFGFFGGLTMILGRGKDARLVTGLANPGPDDHLIDIGCGPGTAARIAAARGALVTGVDPSMPMLRIARTLSRIRPTPGMISWVKTGAEDLTLATDSASICWSLKAVHHWPQLTEGIAEVARVLKPGGRFLTLEKRSPAGATGNASHGWTDAQAQRFSEMLTEAGFSTAEATNHDRGLKGRKSVVIVDATL